MQVGNVLEMEIPSMVCCKFVMGKPQYGNPYADMYPFTEL